MDAQINELERQIAKLPAGYISKKTINGRTYFYYQWTEDGKKKSRYLKPEEAERLNEQIEQRKTLKEQWKALRQGKLPDMDNSYILMHKDIPVAEIVLDTVTGGILRITRVLNPEHLPVGVLIRRGIVDRQTLNDWWIGRSIPAGRSGVRQALEILNIATPQILLTKCFGLSLSDQYWIRPQNENLEWSKINFFDNPFSEDVGDILLGKPVQKEALDLKSPDNTSDGFLKKRWKIFDGKRCLIKAGSPPFMQQPFNEAIASALLRRLGIPHVPYSVLWDDGIPYSVCDDFVTRDTELVSAWRVMQTRKRPNNISVYRHFINCCEALAVPDIVHAVDQMLVADYILANEDRHLNNFGVIRDANTLEMLRFAPIYDSGSSLGYDKLAAQIRSGAGTECKPFKKSHEEQLKLVTDFSWIDFKVLEGITDEAHGILSEAGEYGEESRIDAIVSAMRRRIEKVYALSQMTGDESADDIRGDVEEDIAEDYR